MTYTARFTHRDGSADDLDLGDVTSDTAALQRARSWLFASLSAVSADVFLGDVRVGHLRREAPRFERPAAPWRFGRGMAQG